MNIVEGKTVVMEDGNTKAHTSATKRLRVELRRKDQRIAKLNAENAELK